MKKRHKAEATFSLSSANMLLEDAAESEVLKRRFQGGTKPVIRWVKGDGMDDPITKAAIAQATRLFGSQVDYCICTNGISADRVREVLSWATEPVEWWPANPEDNPELKTLLNASGCLPSHYGYWWKWFPERIRPAAPEWILDGDMVITEAPKWFQEWVSGRDGLRVSQDDRQPTTRWWRKPAAMTRDRNYKYGEYADLVDRKLSLYSGLISLPPGLRYMPEVSKLLISRPLRAHHDGKTNMSEQGVMAVALQNLKPLPIPLHEFPFAHAGTDFIEFGNSKQRRKVWGYHFSRSFVTTNPHFETFVRSGAIFSPPINLKIDKFRWLSGGSGQWGLPGWGMKEEARSVMLDEAVEFIGKKVLDLGTSRGRLAASLADLGCFVTTVDIADRGASVNLQGLGIEVVVDDARDYLRRTLEKFDLIIVDVHGNTPEDWQTLGDFVVKALAPKGKIIINNAELFKVAGWDAETGVKEFLEEISPEWKIKLHRKPAPGLAVISRKRLLW